MKLKRGSTSVRRLIFIGDSSSTVGAGLTGLTSASSGLVCWYLAGDMSTPTQITLVSGTVGTFTSGGFVAVDGTNMPGWYEIGIPNAALDGGNEVAIHLHGATNMVPVNIYVELEAVDCQDATAFGISRIDAAVTSRMASYTQPTGFLAAAFPTTVASTTNITSASGIQLAANQDVRNITGTISDKTGYSLSQAFPANFSALAITVGGAVTAGTVSDKTGYSLSQAFPSNFASLSVDGSGRVLLQPAQTGVTIPTVTSLTNTVTVGTNNDKTGYALTSGERGAIADAVWDEVASGHTTAGTTGAAIIAAGSAGDPWSASLPGAYGAGTAGYIVGNNLNATVSSRSTLDAAGVWSAGVRTITGGTVTAVSDKTGYSLTQSFPSNFAALGINDSGHISRVTLTDTCTANTDMRGTNNALLAADYTAPDNSGIAAIKAKTDTIPTWPTNFASLSVDVSGRVLLQPTQTGVTIPTVTTLTNAVTVSTNNDKTGYVLSSGGVAAIEAALINEGDGQQLINAILQVINSNLDLPALELAAIASAVRSELATELARLDATVSSRLASVSYTAPDNSGISTIGSVVTAIAGYVDTEVAAIKVVTDKLDTAMQLDGSVYQFTANALELAPTTGLTGANTVTITVLLGGLPLEGAYVRLTNGGETGIDQSDVDGEAVFNVNNGTWIVAITAAGATFGGASLVVNGDESQTYSMTVVGSLPSPPAPGLTTVRVPVIDLQGNPLAGCNVSVSLEDANPTIDSALVSRVTYSGVTGVAGYFDLVLIQFASFTSGGIYNLKVSDSNGKLLHQRRVKVPSVSTCYVDDLLDP